jgi:hypothetical protein
MSEIGELGQPLFKKTGVAISGSLPFKPSLDLMKEGFLAAIYRGGDQPTRDFDIRTATPWFEYAWELEEETSSLKREISSLKREYEHLLDKTDLSSNIDKILHLYCSMSDGNKSEFLAIIADHWHHSHLETIDIEKFKRLEQSNPDEDFLGDVQYHDVWFKSFADLEHPESLFQILLEACPHLLESHFRDNPFLMQQLFSLFASFVKPDDHFVLSHLDVFRDFLERNPSLFNMHPIENAGGNRGDAVIGASTRRMSLKTVVLIFLTELALTVLAFLTALIFLTELVLTVLLFLAELFLITVLLFLTELARTRALQSVWA